MIGTSAYQDFLAAGSVAFVFGFVVKLIGLRRLLASPREKAAMIARQHDRNPLEFTLDAIGDYRSPELRAFSCWLNGSKYSEVL